LPAPATLRLGLSATPFDYINTERNERLTEYYGDIVYEYGLRDALANGILAPYEYHVHIVTLSDDETERYEALSREIGQLFASEASTSSQRGRDQLQRKLLERARLLGSAQGKLDSLKELLQQKSHPEPLSLFYCGDGSVEESEGEEVVRQVDAISQILGEQGWRTSQYTSRENKRTRNEILDNFRIGTIDGLVAIRCLDEGVDVPACHSAYLLASARNPRQFIQRRGRVLRKSPGKTHATIHDFLVHIPPGTSEDAKTERRLVKAELERVAEFASLAENFSAAHQKLKPLLEEYSLSHILVSGG
jgi:superfamily II DNA or RNA helicase